MKTTIISKPEDLTALISSVKGKLISLDIEGEPFDDTDPLKSHAWQLEVDGIGIYTPDHHAFVLPSAYSGHKGLQEALETERFVFHNAKHELAVLESLGFDVSNTRYDDTMIMAWLLDENRLKGLKHLAKVVLGKTDVVEFDDILRPDGKGRKPKKDELIPSYDAWIEKLASYCMDDCYNTWLLYHVFSPQMDDEIRKLYERVELPLVRVVANMERRGIAIDVPELESMSKRIEVEVKEIEKKLDASLPGINPNSPVQLRTHLFKTLKLKPDPEMKTPKGDPSTSAEALEYLGKVYPDQPFLQDLLKLRELKKLQSSYIESFKAKHVDGVVYGSFNQAATVTGRFSSSEPNHQNAPASADSGYDIRGLFKPRSGMVYVCADYSQIELRMAAYLSGDPILVDAYANDKDLHQETADAIGCDRKTAKIIGFSLLYGTTSHGLAPRLGVTKQEAENLITAYFDKHKGVKAFMDQAVVSVQRLGYVKSILGRRRRFPEYMEAVRSGEKWLTSRIERQTGNFRVQSSAADLMKKAMVDLDLAKFGAHMLLTVHDELVIECPETNAVACSAHVKEIMENALDLTPIPIKVDPKIGNRWLK